MSRQMSSAMTSAPCWARRIACERPWPRAAPLMTATLPSSSPMFSVRFSSGVDDVANAQVVDLLVRVAELAQDRGCVLSQQREAQGLRAGTRERDVRHEPRVVIEDRAMRRHAVHRGELLVGLQQRS